MVKKIMGPRKMHDSRRKLNDEEELEIVQLFKSGEWSTREIMKAYEVGVRVIDNLRRKYGLIRHYKKKGKESEDCEDEGGG